MNVRRVTATLARRAGVTGGIAKTKTAEELRREAHECFSTGHALMAEASEVEERQNRTALGHGLLAGATANDWIRVDSLPLPKRKLLAACRSGTLLAVKRGRVWITRRRDADAYLERRTGPPADSAADLEDDVRKSLGLVRRAYPR